MKDLDLEQGLVTVRASKGDKDRTTLLPGCLCSPLKSHLERVKVFHGRELAEGHGDVEMPYALQVKYPKAAWEWCWQYVFPAAGYSTDPRSGAVRRHHVGEEVLQRTNAASGNPFRNHKACGCAYPAPLLRNTHADARRKHPGGAGIPRAQQH